MQGEQVGRMFVPFSRKGFYYPPSRLPNTISRPVRTFGVLRHLGPIFREEQPRFLIERVYRLHGLPMTVIGMPSKARNVFP